MRVTGREGWTLVELLLVLVILAVLLALAFPVAGLVRENSLKVACIQHLKSTGTAVLTYTADHNGRIVAASDTRSTTPSNEKTWLKSLYHKGYLANLDMVICPAHAPYNSATRGLNNLMGTAHAYGMRVWGYPDDFGRRFEPKPISLIPEPSRFFLLGDSYWKNHGEQGYIVQPDPADKNQFFHLRHGGKAQMFFVDGSVRPVSREEISELSIGQASFANGQRIQYRCWPEE